MHNRRVVVYRVLLIIGSLFVALALLEFTVRFLPEIPTRSVVMGALWDKTLETKTIVFDEELGFRPGVNWSAAYGRYGFRNGKNFRAKQVNDKDIFIIGDSLVQDGELIRSLKYLMRDKSVRLWNAGVGGYNTLQEALYLEKYISLKPDAIMLVFCLNDFLPSGAVTSSNADKKTHAYFSTHEPLAVVNPTLFHYSKLYRFFIYRWLTLARKRFFRPRP